jgi:peptidoglycan/xylan/chitin deacetylase (PgdA/CDA1 family)
VPTRQDRTGDEAVSDVVGQGAGTQGGRAALKQALAAPASSSPAGGLTALIYHRVGGGTPDERDLSTAAFEAQMDALARHRVVGIDQAIAELQAGDDRQKVVTTFDDGFADVHTPALQILTERQLPFTLYVATAYMDGLMHWDGSTAKAPGPALTWDQLEEVAASPLCTIGNHTHNHARPEKLTVEELDTCTALLEDRLGITPRHFAYTWGIPVPAMEHELRARFDSAVTGELGRNHPGVDPIRLKRIPVRGSDPLNFFEAKLTGRLLPERTYAAVVATAKRVGLQA